MIWIFERLGEALQLETRVDNDTGEFVLIVHQSSAGPQVERYRDAEEFRLRLEALETQLEADRWTQRGPVLLHDGWKIG